MKINIHRGANEIGGTCIQLSTEKTTILLDLGLPLRKDSKELDVAALKPDAVFISHPHQDHFGLIEALDHNIPVYMGELSKNLINATSDQRQLLFTVGSSNCRSSAIAGYQNDPQVNFVYAHTSGHATVGDLQKFAEALNPKMLVPVHTEYGNQYENLFQQVVIFEDGVVFILYCPRTCSGTIPTLFV